MSFRGQARRKAEQFRHVVCLVESAEQNNAFVVVAESKRDLRNLVSHQSFPSWEKCSFDAGPLVVHPITASGS